MPKREKTAAYIQAALKKSQLPRNQIASFSGLSNAYIRDLEAGKFQSVRREKLISLAVAVSLTLYETDQLLAVFDRTALSLDDIPIFLNIANLQWASSAMLPLKDDFSLELAILSGEKIPGIQYIVSFEPTYCLYSKGHRQYMERKNVATHPLYGSLVEAITDERRRSFREHLKQYPVIQFICRNCFKQYITNSDTAKERKWRKQHIANIADCLLREANFELYLIDTCPRIPFSLKASNGASDQSDKVFFIFWPRHQSSGKRTSRLCGYTTDNPVVIRNFKDEINALESNVIEKYRDRGALIQWIRELPG